MRSPGLADIKAVLLAQRGKLDLGRLQDDARELLTTASYGELVELISEFG